MCKITVFSFFEITQPSTYMAYKHVIMQNCKYVKIKPQILWNLKLFLSLCTPFNSF